MSKEPGIPYGALRRIEQGLGRQEQGMADIREHCRLCRAEARGLRSEFQSHCGQLDAHGARARSEVWASIGKVLTITIGGGTLLIAALELAMRFLGG